MKKAIYYMLAVCSVVIFAGCPVEGPDKYPGKE